MVVTTIHRAKTNLSGLIERAERGEEIMMSTLSVTNETERGVGYAGAFPEFTAFVDNLVSERLESEDPPDDAITICTPGPP